MEGALVTTTTTTTKKSGMTSCDRGNGKKYFYDPEFQ